MRTYRKNIKIRKDLKASCYSANTLWGLLDSIPQLLQELDPVELILPQLGHGYSSYF